MEYYIEGNYVVTAIPNAFNKKVSFWISRKDYTAAHYMFSVYGYQVPKELRKLSEEGITPYIKMFEDLEGEDI